MQIAALIVAAGRGVRAGGGLAKQWRPLAGETVVQRSIDAFDRHPRIARLVLVVPPESDPALWPRQAAGGGMIVTRGGATRTSSVRRGLDVLEGTDISHVLIHDAARPCVTTAVIDRVIAALGNHQGAAPALAVTDALWQVAGGRVTGRQGREGLARAQTPQGFALAAIRAAHRSHPAEAADDVGIALAAGLDIAMVQGDEDNIKITGPEDFVRAARILERAQMDTSPDIRTGTGFDVHRFGPGDHVVLCGVRVPHDRALQGHSDADVGMHALTDALYGALAAGDIGRHFPPSDPQWKGAESRVFLAHACGLARERGWRIGNLDVTLICERPKVGPHAEAMIAALAGICGLEADRVSVKATTTERLGFAGREEGIAAMSSVTLVRP